jgi:hypothetical protein
LFDKSSERAEVALVVDLTAVHLRNERADHVPGNLGWSDVGAPLGNLIDPSIDNEAAAFIL